MNSNSNNQILKALYGVALAGMILSLCFGISGSPAARAQEAGTAMPIKAPTETAVPPEPARTPMPRPPSFPPSYLPFMDELKVGGKIPAQAANETGAQAITLGASGLSFRYLQTFGVTVEPYLADTTHINRPNGLFMDSSDNLYITEDAGNRVLKYDSTGNNVLALGKAGVCSTEEYAYCTPKDVTLDQSGNIWVADGNRVVQYDASGVFLQQLPPDDPWNTGDDNIHFNDARGIAFDNGGQMFVSDTNNQRIQVYDLTSGSPVYSTTIGVNGETGSDNNHFNQPYRIAVDASNRLYVVDNGNNRVQRCTYSGSWSCATFDTGLNNPQGITTDPSNNVYIADTYNGRVRKCSSAGTCGDLITETYGLFDVAVDSSGNIYGAAIYERIVAKYDSSGGWSGTFVGVELVPYLTDGYHYFHPRVAIDPGNNIIILEENGQRLVKLDSNGNFLWSFGTPGVDAPDNDHLNWPHSVATDSGGKIYVADNCRVQIISPDGNYVNTLGTGCGTGNYQFGWATGVDVDKNGQIYVADYPNHRVQIYNSSRDFVGSIGATGVCSTANNRLCSPIAVDVDDSGNIYVTDAGNLRVQKFNSSRVWQMTIGDGTWGDSFNQLAWPEDVVVDAQGRILVTDWANNRVQVFDPSGAYLTTIGGSWGSNTSQLKGAPGVDVDSSGNVYVADWDNHRIQKFALGVPGWQQANINGFGDRYNGAVQSLEVFSGTLYAGASNWDNGGSIWRSTDAQSWTQVTEPGFGNTYTNTNPTIIDMVVFNGQLYAGTGWGGMAGQLWRSTNGTTWNQVVGDGFGDADNGAIAAMAVYSGMLYVGTGNGSGAQIWRSSSGDNLSWTNVVTGGLGCGDCGQITGLIVFNDSLYAAVEAHTDPPTGMQIWRTANGSDWSQVGATGFGSAENYQTGGFAIFNGNLYVGTRNDVTGGQVWRSGNGSTWTQVVGDGFGDSNNYKVESLQAFGGDLYAGTDNSVTGIEIWRSADGTTWSQINPDGFGDSNNDSTLWSSATAVFNNRLFIGTGNWANGGEVWQMLKQQIYLPLIIR